MSTPMHISDYAISIGHNEAGRAVAILTSPSALQVDPVTVADATGYSIDPETGNLDLQSAGGLLMTLQALPDPVMKCALDRLPLLVMQEGGMKGPLVVHRVEVGQ